VTCSTPPADGGVDGPGPAPDNFVFLANVSVSTPAGGPTAGTTDGAYGIGLLSNPVSVTIEPGGALVVTDFDTDRLREMATDGTLSTLTTQTGFTRPYGLGWVGTTLYAQTDANPSGVRGLNAGTIWRIDRPSGVATSVAANVGRPRAFAALSDGRLVLSDFLNARVRLLDLGTGTLTDLAGAVGCPGSANGTGTDARFVSPQGVVVLAGDRIILADRDAHLLREISTAGVVTTFAGDGVAGTIDGPRATARFTAPTGLAADASGDVFVSDIGAHRIRRIAADGTVTTVAGDGTAGFMDGPGFMAEFWGQEGITASADGATLFVADGNGGSDTVVPYNRVRKITIGP
jgi:hypothetical protein